jgi:hypothetical protein
MSTLGSQITLTIEDRSAPISHFAPTPLRHPPFSAAAVPFAWMLVEDMTKLGEEHALDVQGEPDLGFATTWVQDHQNQRALLDCFASHLRPEQSLCATLRKCRSSRITVRAAY